MRHYKKIFTSFLKILVSLILLYLVFTKIEFDSIWLLIKESNIFFIFLSLFAFVISQWISSLRLLLYFRESDFYLSEKSNHILYLIGMFYNFFIPGGIGGDAYKVYLLNKRFKWEVKKLTFSVLTDRISGLIAIVILIEILSLFFLPDLWKLLVPFVLILTVAVSYWILTKWLPYFKSIYFKSLVYSILVQLFQLLCIFFILKSFVLETNDILVYFLVFLISSVLSVLSFSGIGIREWLFLKASEVFAFHSELSVSIAMLFSFLTAFVSLAGIFFQIRKIPINLDKDQSK